MAKQVEVELKAKVRSLPNLQRHLREIGARLVKRIHQVDTYYSPYRQPLGKRKGKVLRVREERISGQTRFELHIPKNTYAAEELEVRVSDASILHQILKQLKYRREFVIDKQRAVYSKGKLEIVIDKVRGLGMFIEVELMGSDSQTARKRLHATLEQLGIPKRDILFNLHYHQMALKKQGRYPNNAYF